MFLVSLDLEIALSQECNEPLSHILLIHYTLGTELFPSISISLSFFFHLSQHKEITLMEESSFGIPNFAVFIIPYCMAADVSLFGSFLQKIIALESLCALVGAL